MKPCCPQKKPQHSPCRMLIAPLWPSTPSEDRAAGEPCLSEPPSPGPCFPPVSRWIRCAREDVGRSAHEVEVCVTTCVPAGPMGSAAAGAANPVKQRWPEAGPRGRPEGGQRLARGVGWRGAQPVGGHHGGPGGQSRFPHTSGKDHPKGTGSVSVAHNVENINGLLCCCHSNHMFKKYPAFYCVSDAVRLTSSFPAPTRRKGKESCPAPWHFFINVN